MFGAGSWGLTLRTAQLLCQLFSNVAKFTVVLSLSICKCTSLIFFIGAIMLLWGLTIWILYEMPRLVRLDDEPPKASPNHAVTSVLLFKASKISRIALGNAVLSKM